MEAGHGRDSSHQGFFHGSHTRAQAKAAPPTAPLAASAPSNWGALCLKSVVRSSVCEPKSPGHFLGGRQVNRLESFGRHVPRVSLSSSDHFVALSHNLSWTGLGSRRGGEVISATRKHHFSLPM